MKFLFCSNLECVPFGGSEELWSLAALRLKEKGHQVMAAVKEPFLRSRRADELRSHGVLLATSTPRRFQRVRNQVARLFRGAGIDLQQEYLEKKLREFRPDLVVVNHCTNLDHVSGLERCLREDWPFVTVSQAAMEDYWPDDRALEVFREAYPKARRHYFVSRHNLDLTARQMGLSLGQAEVVANPYNASFARAFSWPTEEVPKFAVVGRIEPKSKGHDLILDVLQRERWRKRRFSVTCFGTGEFTKALLASAASRGITQFHVGGFVRDLAEVWDQHHCLLLPSRHEGLPLSLVEAMIYGRPAIVTRVGGNAELLREGVTGFFARFPDADELDAAMERAWDRQNSWREMGERAYREVREMFPEDPVGCFAEALEAVALK